jgi:hypothetical protein
MTNRALWSLILVLSSALAGLAGSRPASADPAKEPTEALSPELRAAFIAEMQSLDTGLQGAVSAIARADWAAVERIARAIKGTFILEQRLGPEQLNELHRVLPEHFLELDRQFHAQSERLAHAAKAADGELTAFYAYKLTEACVSCHAQYARHRFQAVTPPPDAHHH